MIAIVDCGSGNLGSVKNALEYLKAESEITGNPRKIMNAERVILPGVGAFGFMMGSLRDRGLEEPLRKSIGKGVPFLGICLGMQALFESSEESEGARGLGVFRGAVERFRRGKVPQVGWNKVVPAQKGLLQEGYAYFVNSYCVVPEERGIVAATTDYFGTFASAIQWENVTAVQFHPEKSGSFGLEFLQRWLEC